MHFVYWPLYIQAQRNIAKTWCLAHKTISHCVHSVSIERNVQRKSRLMLCLHENKTRERKKSRSLCFSCRNFHLIVFIFSPQDENDWRVTPALVPVNRKLLFSELLLCKILISLHLAFFRSSRSVCKTKCKLFNLCLMFNHRCMHLYTSNE